MVDSWIPTSLRTNTSTLSSRSFEPLQPALPPRLGLGAKPKLSEITSSNQLRTQLLKRKSSIKSGEDSIPIIAGKEEEEEEEEDSRTKTSFGSKKTIIDRFQPRAKISNSMRTTPDTERTSSIDEHSSQSRSLLKPEFNQISGSNSLHSTPSDIETKKAKESSSMIIKSNHLTSIPSTPESDGNPFQIANPPNPLLNPLTLSKKQVKRQRKKAMKKLRREEKKAQEEKELVGRGSE
ncbi:hypothetical protein DFH28DRAFT_920748 [Melampsora americana]|nr:hypothetical protein DFH28DRAFT_920748 [Melampsora americana]